MDKNPEHWTSQGIRLDSEGARLLSPAWAVCPLGPALEQACSDSLLFFHYCEGPFVFTHFSQVPEVLCGGPTSGVYSRLGSSQANMRALGKELKFKLKVVMEAIAHRHVSLQVGKLERPQAVVTEYIGDRGRSQPPVSGCALWQERG